MEDINNVEHNENNDKSDNESNCNDEPFDSNNNEDNMNDRNKNMNECYVKDINKAIEHRNRGNDYYKVKSYDEAIEEYTKAIDYCPDVEIMHQDDNINDNENNDRSEDDDHRDNNNNHHVNNHNDVNNKTDAKEQQNTNENKIENENEKKEKEEIKNYLSTFYGNRAACYLALENYEQTIEDCSRSLEYNPTYIKALFRRAQAYEKTSKYYDAQNDYKKILEIDKNMDLAKASISRLEPKVKEEQERQKEEVIGTLKNFANWGLGKLGLSLDNFEAKQDPATGGYNIQFNPNSQSKS